MKEENTVVTAESTIKQILAAVKSQSEAVRLWVKNGKQGKPTQTQFTERKKELLGSVEYKALLESKDGKRDQGTVRKAFQYAAELFGLNNTQSGKPAPKKKVVPSVPKVKLETSASPEDETPSGSIEESQDIVENKLKNAVSLLVTQFDKKDDYIIGLVEKVLDQLVK